MKKVTITLLLLISLLAQSQELKQISSINVSGEGKIKVVPDLVTIKVSIETIGLQASKVKKENDSKMDVVLKLITKEIARKEDYQTQRISLRPNYDYEKKEHNFVASQTIEIVLRDITKYDVLMEGLVNSGINTIDNIEFKSTKMMQLQSEARKLAVKEAKTKAEDLVAVLGQKVGKALTISDNSQNYNPPVQMYAMASMKMNDVTQTKQTLAIGEIEIVANVSISFVLE